MPNGHIIFDKMEYRTPFELTTDIKLCHVRSTSDLRLQKGLLEDKYNPDNLRKSKQKKKTTRKFKLQDEPKLEETKAMVQSKSCIDFAKNAGRTKALCFKDRFKDEPGYVNVNLDANRKSITRSIVLGSKHTKSRRKRAESPIVMSALDFDKTSWKFRNWKRPVSIEFNKMEGRRQFNDKVPSFVEVNGAMRVGNLVKTWKENNYPERDIGVMPKMKPKKTFNEVLNIQEKVNEQKRKEYEKNSLLKKVDKLTKHFLKYSRSRLELSVDEKKGRFDAFSYRTIRKETKKSKFR